MKKPSSIATGVSFAGLSMAAYEVFFPTKTMPTGKWSFMLGPIWEAWGSAGLSVYWVAATAIAVFADQFIGENK